VIKLKKIVIISFLLILIDQAIKLVIINNLDINQVLVIINNFLMITHVINIGAAFSILQGKQIFLILFSIIFLIILGYILKKIKTYKNIDIIIYSLVISGIVGNLIDRIVHGYVIDFISFKFIDYYFPIFNLADSFIVVGCTLYIYKTIKEEIKCKNLQ